MSGILTGSPYHRALVTICLCALCTLWADPASTQQDPSGQSQPDQADVTYTLQGNQLLVWEGETQKTTIELECEGLSMFQQGKALYVACGARGLLELDATDPQSPSRVKLTPFEGAVLGVMVYKGRLWVEVQRIELVPAQRAAPADALPTQIPPLVVKTPSDKTSDAPKVPPSGRAHGEVVDLAPDGVVIQLTEGSLEQGDHVELLVEQEEQLGESMSTSGLVRVAIGEVILLKEDRARVRLGLNESVPVGAVARQTDKDTTNSTFAPPRPDSRWQIGFMARPFLAIGTVGVGSVNDVDVVHRMKNQIALHMRLQPLGLGVSEEGNIAAIAPHFLATYDTDLFEIGLGLGYSTLIGSNDRGSATTNGIHLAQLVRLGALDGLHLRIDNSFIFTTRAGFNDFDGTPTDEEELVFEYSGTVAALQIPLGRRSWLLLRGGARTDGYGYGELALRVLLRGNGGPGSLFITPSFGGAGLFGATGKRCEREFCFDDEITMGGPMIGFGMEWRY